jgi:hypothetical protein
MKIDVRHNIPSAIGWLNLTREDTRRAAREALNRVSDIAKGEVTQEMARVFDRPVPFTLRSLRVYYANTATLTAKLWFRQRSADRDKPWAVPQIEGGSREMKPMELRLMRANLLPKGWLVVPGQAMPLDAYGNMNRGEVSRILNVLGTFTEAGYSKANEKTRERLRKGTKASYGFAYWVNPVPGRRGHQPHLLPGIYRRIYTPFGQAIKPMMIFVERATYRRRLDFFRIVERAADANFSAEFDKAMHSLQTTGSASAIRRRA